MRKQFLAFLILMFSIQEASANHTKGGWMYYEYLGPGASPNSSIYRITLKVYTECILNPGQADNAVSFTFFNPTNNALVYNISVPLSDDITVTNCNSVQCHPCINNPPAICYRIRSFVLEREFPNTNAGYIISYQRCCRIAGIVNIQSPSANQGETWTVKIPGTSIPNAEKNSSARFAQNDTAMICQNESFNFDFSAIDPDNDSLVYSFTSAFSGGGPSGGNAAPDPSAPPPFPIIPYSGGYSGSQPLGPGVTINSQTGIVSGIAPAIGIYVITAVVSEYDRSTGLKISEVRKSLHIQVEDCSSTKAALNPEYISCDGFSFNFSNNASPQNIQTYFWDFGDGNTSILESPSHTYADTGVYTMKLAVNRGGACSDSTTSIVRVFPGYFPGFTDNTPTCKGVPVQFRDATIANYGNVNYWRWDFGVTNLFNDTSRIRNPIYAYTDTGTYNVSLVVASTKGCIDTVYKTIRILDKAPFAVFPKDTLICSIDTLQLRAQATTGGNVTWGPNYMINNVNSFTPLVSPDVTTKYYVSYADSFGCKADDSINVRVLNQVTLQSMGDTTICTTDSITLRLNTDALYFTWTPSAGLNNSTIKNPKASPATTTTYHLVASIGKCTKEADIKVTPIPYPVANAGKDSSICFGNDAQLQASGGSIYLWSPAVYLSNANISNPRVIKPQQSVRYIVMVRDVLGCPKPVYDTMFLEVVKINANAGPRDTSVVLGQPLQLNATGSEFYLWDPSTWLNNPNIHNPISLPQDNIEYVVKVSNANGCVGYDTINVKLYKLSPSLYVPSAFSPGGDNVNDIFRPIALGIKSLESFRVYNRWGQLIFSTTQIGKGWDGNFRGQPQSTGTFVWYAEATDYLGKKIAQKGTVILIR